MIIGATPESDRHIMGLAESLYKKYSLKRVFFSAYLPVNSDSCLPALDVRPPLLREHRLYQADWLLRYYDFSAWELLTEEEPNFDPYLDPNVPGQCATRNFSPWRSTLRPRRPCCVFRVSGPKVHCGFCPPAASSTLEWQNSSDGGCAETCPVLYYLQRPRRSPRNPAGNRRGAAGPQGICRGTQQLSLDDFTPKVLPDAAPAVQKLAAAGMPARQAAYEVKQEALQCLTRRM